MANAQKIRMDRFIAKHGRAEVNRRQSEQRLARIAAETPEQTEARRAKAREATKRWRENNKEKARKSAVVGQWAKWGVDPTPYASLHDLYDERYLPTLNCEQCDVVLTTGSKITATTRCMDHDHDTKLFRNIVCHGCNNRRGCVDNPRPKMSPAEQQERKLDAQRERRAAPGYKQASSDYQKEKRKDPEWLEKKRRQNREYAARKRAKAALESAPVV